MPHVTLSTLCPFEVHCFDFLVAAGEGLQLTWLLCPVQDCRDGLHSKACQASAEAGRAHSQLPGSWHSEHQDAGGWLGHVWDACVGTPPPLPPPFLALGPGALGRIAPSLNAPGLRLDLFTAASTKKRERTKTKQAQDLLV